MKQPTKHEFSSWDWFKNSYGANFHHVDRTKQVFGHTCFIDLEIVERCLTVRGGGEGTAGEVDMVGGAKDEHTLTAIKI